MNGEHNRKEAVHLYKFEPRRVDIENFATPESDYTHGCRTGSDQVKNFRWCFGCQIMPTNQECHCCAESITMNDSSGTIQSSDGVTKVNTDSLSSDPSQQVKTKDPSSPSHVLKTKSPQSFRANPQASPSFRKNTLGESSSTTLSNSIPGIRHKEPQYPLDKYLPRAAKRDETFIKSREIPLRKDVSLFRKIESLLKESQCIREPIVNCVLTPGEAQVNVSSESSISTEDLVAAEFYKATYGTPKKADCISKPKVPLSSPNKGAGDWVDTRSPQRCDLRPKPQIENDCREGATAMPLPWDGRNRISALSPKTVQTETCFHPASLQTFESFGHYKMSNDYGFNMDENRELEKLNALDIEKSHPKPKVSEACSFSSFPSVSIRTSTSRFPNKSRTSRKVTVQNACINTDRVNTHVFSMKHPDPEVVDDFAGQSRVKACVVQELPKVNIRARLVQQSCGFVSITPVRVPNEVQNTAVVEVSHYNGQTEQPVDRHISAGVSYSPKRQTVQNVQNSLKQYPPDIGYYANQPQQSPKKCIPDKNHEPSFGHRLAFDVGRRCMSPQGQLSDQNTKPKIFDTVSHIKEQLSRDFNCGFESIKLSLAEMVSSLNEFCDIGLNNVQGLRNVSSTSKTNPLTLQDRVDRMDGILTEELTKWGQRDSAHYKLLTKAIDELTNEIKTAVESFHQQQHLDERTKAFLGGSVASAPHQNRVINQNTLEAAHPPEPLRLDKLYAIHSYLQQNQPPATTNQGHPDSRSDRQPYGNYTKEENLLTIKTKFDETFTIDPSPPDQGFTNIEDTLGEKHTSPQIENIIDKGEIREDYEDDFIPEDQEDDPDNQLSESDSSEPNSDTSRSDKKAGDVMASKTNENLVVHLTTSGSANGEESTDAPLAQIVHEEPPSSVASTIRASQANLKPRVVGCNIHMPKPIQTVSGPIVQKTMKNADGNSDKPLVRLTNRNTNAVFELRLPEQLENLNSILTYNSVGCNDEIKLSFGCSGLKEKSQTTVPENFPIDAAATLDKNIAPKAVHDKICLGDSGSQPKKTSNNEQSRTKNADGVIYNSGHLQHIESLRGQRVTVSAETFPPDIPRVTLRNQATQFPTVEMESVERLSASILTLVESKMNEMVETNKQKLLSNESKFKDVSVQVILGPEVGEQQIASSGSNVVMPAASAALGLTSTNVHTPGKATQLPQITPNITPLDSDGYDSHPKNLDKPTDYLVLKQTEREVEKLLTQNSKYPVQLESSFSSMSVPTSLSEFPVKSGSTSSSELAFPLDKGPDPVTTFDDLRRLHPAPEFDAVDTPKDKQEEQGSVELENHQHPLGDISTHLHPNPEDLTELHPATCVELEEEIKEANEDAKSDVDETNPVHTCIYEIQPYDSDLMSEGEVGYVYTSNSYSSGEIVERRRPSTAVHSGVPRLAVGGRTCSGDGVGAACDKHSEERTVVVDLDSSADDTSRLNEESSTSTETTTSET